MHLADAFIQSDLQCIQAIHCLSVCVPWELNPQPLRCWRNALPLSHFEDLYTLAKLQIVVKCNYTAELQWRYWKSTTLVSYQHRSATFELPLPGTSPVPSDQMLTPRSGWRPVRLLLQETRTLLLELSEREQTAWSEQTEHDSHWPWNMTTWDLDDVNVRNEHSSGLVY